MNELALLAPAVVAMRMPLLWAEAMSGKKGGGAESRRAVEEKTAAFAQGMAQAQLSLAMSASRFWLDILGGHTPALLDGRAADQALRAFMGPSRKAVKGNLRRLSGR